MSASYGYWCSWGPLPHSPWSGGMQSVLKFSEPSSPYANLGKPLLGGRSLVLRRDAKLRDQHFASGFSALDYPEDSQSARVVRISNGSAGVKRFSSSFLNLRIFFLLNRGHPYACAGAS